MRVMHVAASRALPSWMAGPLGAAGGLAVVAGLALPVGGLALNFYRHAVGEGPLGDVWTPLLLVPAG